MAKMQAAATTAVAAIPQVAPSPDREALDREALTEAQKPSVKGKLKAEVTAPTGTKVEVEGKGAFKDTESSRTTKVAEPEAMSI